MLKLITALLGTLLKYARIPTDIKKRDFDIRKSLFAIAVTAMLSGTIFTIDRLYMCTKASAVAKEQHHILVLENTKLKAKKKLLKVKLKSCNRQTKVCKTISCAIENNYEE